MNIIQPSNLPTLKSFIVKRASTLGTSTPREKKPSAPLIDSLFTANVDPPLKIHFHPRKKESSKTNFSDYSRISKRNFLNVPANDQLDSLDRKTLFEAKFFHLPSSRNIPEISINPDPELKENDNKVRVSTSLERNRSSFGKSNTFLPNYQIIKKSPSIASYFKKENLPRNSSSLSSEDWHCSSVGNPAGLKDLFDENDIKNKSATSLRTEKLSKIIKFPSLENELTMHYLYPNARYIIFPNDIFKRLWNIIITLFLLFTAIVTPFRIAFYDVDDLLWSIIDWITIGVFSFDIVINFLSAFYDQNEDLVYSHREIASKYLKTWFFIDIISVIPISSMIETSEVGSLARLAKLPRLYRLIKMTKLLRMLKIVKERGRFAKYMRSLFQISSGLERILYFVFVFMLLCHICACLWYFTSRLDNFVPETWVVSNGYYDLSPTDVYVACFYFTVTTVTTVGYGDITAGTTGEKILSIIIMFIGVMAYSFAVGSLSSVLSSMDTKKAKLKEKLETLEEIRKDYNISQEMYIRLKKVIKFDHSRDETEKLRFIKELPHQLRAELGYKMHRNIIEKISFFKNRDPFLISFIGNMLKPIKVFQNQYIYQENDPIDGIYFLAEGEAAFVLEEYSDIEYLKIPESYYFGDFDIYDSSADKRVFTVKAISDCELMFISSEDLDKLNQKFPEIIDELIKKGETRYLKCCFERENAKAQKTNKPLHDMEVIKEEEEEEISKFVTSDKISKDYVSPSKSSALSKRNLAILYGKNKHESIHDAMRERRESFHNYEAKPKSHPEASTFKQLVSPCESETPHHLSVEHPNRIPTFMSEEYFVIEKKPTARSSGENQSLNHEEINFEDESMDIPWEKRSTTRDQVKTFNLIENIKNEPKKNLEDNQKL